MPHGLMVSMLAEPTDNAAAGAGAEFTLRAVGSPEFGALADRLIAIYIAAMRYPPGTAAGRYPLWLEHSSRSGFGCVVAVDADGEPVAFGYGYTGSAGQWWHNEVQRGMSRSQKHEWLTNYFELTELHVRPDNQGKRLGERILRALLTGRPEGRALLSTPEGENRAWRLYRRLGFADVLRQYKFTGDPRPFGVLGRRLPLDV
jgi:ribosomal protein S18 acetylase RimI-like enzyme